MNITVKQFVQVAVGATVSATVALPAMAGSFETAAPTGGAGSLGAAELNVPVENNNNSASNSETSSNLQQSGSQVVHNTNIQSDGYSEFGRGIVRCPSASVGGYGNIGSFGGGFFRNSNKNIGIQGNLPLGKRNCRKYEKAMLYRGITEICFQLQDRYMSYEQKGYVVDFAAMVADANSHIGRRFACPKPQHIVKKAPAPVQTYTPPPAPPAQLPQLNPQALPIPALCNAEKDCPGSEKFGSRNELRYGGGTQRTYTNPDIGEFQFAPVNR